MAEESRITNVEGELGVASEVTMRKLLEQMQKMAKATGKDPNGQESKVRESLTKSLLGEIKVVEGNTSKLGKLATSLHPATLGLKLLTSSVFGFSNMLGNSIRTVTGFGQELFETSTRMSDFAKHIPMVGRQLEVLAKIMDNTRDNFTQIAMSGADFNNSMSQFRISAREAGGSLEEYTRFVRDNTERMAAFGGTVTRGAMQVSRMTDVMDDELRENLLSMGLNFEDINEQMVYYQYLNRAGARTRIQDEAAQAAAVASLTKNMLTLSKLTGEDVKKRQEAIAEAQMNIAFQMEMAKMTEEQRAAVTEQMNRMSLFGEEGINAVKRSVLGMPAITEGQQAFLLANRDLVSQMEKNLGIIKSGDPSAIEDQSDFLVNALQSYVNSLNTYENMLRVGAVGGLSGIAEEMANQLNIPSDLVLKFLKVDKATGKFVLDMEALGKNMKEIQESLNPDDNEMTIMATFLRSLADIRKSITENLVNPLLEMVNPILGEMTGLMGDMAEEGSFFNAMLKGLKPVIYSFGTMIENFITDLKGEGGVAQALKNLFDSMETEFKNFWNGPTGQVLSDTISGMFSTVTEKIFREFILLMDKYTPFFGPAAGKIRMENEVTERYQDKPPEVVREEINQRISELEPIFTELVKKTLSGKLTDEENTQFRDIQGELRILNDILKNNGYSRGSNGFVDFGSGTPAMLHGREAVVPEDSEMGQLLKLASLNGFGWGNNNPPVSPGSRSRRDGRGVIKQEDEDSITNHYEEEIRFLESRLVGLQRDLVFGKMLGNYEEISKQIQDTKKQIDEYRDKLNNIPGMRHGSDRFVDFGSGTPEVLSEMDQLLQLSSPTDFGWTAKSTPGSFSRFMSQGKGTVLNQEGPPKWMGGSPRPTSGFLRGLMRGLIFGPISLGAKIGFFSDINPGIQDRPRGFEDPFRSMRPQNPAGLVPPTDPDSSAFIKESAWGEAARLSVVVDILLGKISNLAKTTSPLPPFSLAFDSEEIRLPIRLPKVLELGDTGVNRIPPSTLQAPVVDSIDVDSIENILGKLPNFAPTTSPRPLPRPTVPEIRLPEDLDPKGFGDTGVNRVSPSTLQAPVIDSIENLNNSITSFEESSNRTGNNNTELQKQLNTIMKDIKSALLEMRDINKRIETNTRGIATNAFSGRVTSKV